MGDKLARYPGKEWYGRNCFGYDSTMPKDYRGFYPFWRPAANGDILDCAHAYQNVAPEGGKPANFPKSYQMSSRYSTESDFGQKKAGSTMPGYAFTTAQSYASLLQKGYMPYYPHRSRMSPFYHQAWFWAPTSNPKHDEIPQSLGGNINELILFNFQALNGRWAFPHTGPPSSLPPASDLMATLWPLMARSPLSPPLATTPPSRLSARPSAPPPVLLTPTSLGAT